MIICHAMTQTHDTVIEGKISDCIIVENKNIENSNFTNNQQLLTLEKNQTLFKFFYYSNSFIIEILLNIFHVPDSIALDVYCIVAFA